MNIEHQTCIDACNACVIACEHCATSCIQEGNPAMSRCIELDRTCADICALAAREMARGSDFFGDICSVCAKICRACGEECAQHEADHCQECARTCEECASECEKWAGELSFATAV